MWSYNICRVTLAVERVITQSKSVGVTGAEIDLQACLGVLTGLKMSAALHWCIGITWAGGAVALIAREAPRRACLGEARHDGVVDAGGTSCPVHLLVAGRRAAVPAIESGINGAEQSWRTQRHTSTRICHLTRGMPVVRDCESARLGREELVSTDETLTARCSAGSCGIPHPADIRPDVVEDGVVKKHSVLRHHANCRPQRRLQQVQSSGCQRLGCCRAAIAGKLGPSQVTVVFL